MDDLEKRANKLHISLCHRCAHDVKFEQKIVRCLKKLQAEEREECARVAEEKGMLWKKIYADDIGFQSAGHIAAAIRRRGEGK